MKRRLLTLLRRTRTWIKRFAVAVLMHSGFLSPSMLLLWLEWLREDMHPQHPGMPTVLAEIAEIRERGAR
jgi:hypothetical protein